MSVIGSLTLIPKTPAEVSKAILYIALTGVAILQTSIAGGISTLELLQLAIAIIGLVPVYLLTGTKVKTTAAFILAALQALVLLVADGTDLANVPLENWIGVLLAAFAAIGVAIVPNKPMIDARDSNTITNVTVINEASTNSENVDVDGRYKPGANDIV